MVEQLKKSDTRHDLTENEIIELCFTTIQKHNNIIEQSRAAVILSGYVKSGLGKRTRKFLQENPNIPERVREILSSSIMRMEGY